MLAYEYPGDQSKGPTQEHFSTARVFPGSCFKRCYDWSVRLHLGHCYGRINNPRFAGYFNFQAVSVRLITNKEFDLKNLMNINEEKDDNNGE